jgi:nucleotide-binding universal stress UspA family protein
MIAFKDVLVPTDFSEPSLAALAYGRELARSFGATLHILHVADGTVATAGPEFFAAAPITQAEIENAAWRQLDALLPVREAIELRVQKEVRAWSSPAAAIVEYADTNDIDLIVMGTHGRNALARLLMGSVAERVVRTSSCPVLTVRARHRAAADLQPVAAAS